MAYISTPEVAAIRKQLKAQLPEYKFSVKRDHSSSVTVAFMKGPAFKEFQTRDRYTGEYSEATMDGHEQLNHHWATDFYGEENGAVIKKVEKIIKTAPFMEGVGDMWFDESDSMTDYFHTAYYFSIHVGKWDKNYQVV
tara:strand:+ start:130 stop:543 length:414 start_codon:yes stop_codon:yes gene_type:complete